MLEQGVFRYSVLHGRIVYEGHVLTSLVSLECAVNLLSISEGNPAIMKLWTWTPHESGHPTVCCLAFPLLGAPVSPTALWEGQR